MPPPPQDQPPFPWWLVLIAAALAALIVRIHLRMPAHMAAKATGDTDKIFVYGSAVYTLLRLMKYKPAPGETPLLFARRLDRQKALPVQVLPLWRIMAMSHYSRVEPGPAEAARARGDLYPALQAAEPLRKLRFMFIAAFGKNAYTGLDTPLVHEEPKPQYDYTSAVAQKKGQKAAREKRRQAQAQQTAGENVPHRPQPRPPRRKPEAAPTLQGAAAPARRPDRPPRPAPRGKRAKPARPGGGVPTAGADRKRHRRRRAREGGGMP